MHKGAQAVQLLVEALLDDAAVLERDGRLVDDRAGEEPADVLERIDPVVNLLQIGARAAGKPFPQAGQRRQVNSRDLNSRGVALP